MHNAIVIKGQPATSSQSAAESSIKSILLHVQNDVSMDQRLQVALSVARAAGARLGTGRPFQSGRQRTHLSGADASQWVQSHGEDNRDRCNENDSYRNSLLGLGRPKLM